jgi:Raf kinase inhibitor-like YbhB/YbcL family protein
MVNKLNLTIKLNKDNICNSHGGKNKTPEISWNNTINLSKQSSKPPSYALIMEDPDAPTNFIHWYLPYISANISKLSSLTMNNINKINKINNIKNRIKSSKVQVINGYNSLGEIGYYGPCNPESNRVHRYIFTLYALDGTVDSLKINSSKEFEDILSKNNIHIMNKDQIIYKYKKDGELTI